MVGLRRGLKALSGAELGYRVAIVEAGTIGGTCVNRGCVPSKTLMRAAAVYHRAGHHAFQGVRTRQEALDWAALIGHTQTLESLRQEKYVEVLASYDNIITLLQGWARLHADGGVEVAEQLYHPVRLVIATGARNRTSCPWTAWRRLRC